MPDTNGYYFCLSLHCQVSNGQGHEREELLPKQVLLKFSATNAVTYVTFVWQVKLKSRSHAEQLF